MQEVFSIIKYILHSNIINFILMLIILAWLVRKFNLGKSFEESTAMVEAGIKKSDNEKLKSQEKLVQAKALMDKLPEDIKALKLSSKEKGEIFKREIEGNAQKTISGINHNIEHSLEVEEQKFSNVLTDKTSVASLELAALHIKNLLEYNPELHNKFIRDSLDELDKVIL